MSETYTKADLLKELAQAAHISRRRAEVVLETLTQVAYREARRGFAVPGICRLDVVHRRARQVRNPQTSQILSIAEHDALRVRPVKRAKDAIAPTPRALVRIVDEPVAAATTAEAPPLPPRRRLQIRRPPPRQSPHPPPHRRPSRPPNRFRLPSRRRPRLPLPPTMTTGSSFPSVARTAARRSKRRWR